MTEHKFTDEEVIKALERCVLGIGAVCQCRVCPYYYATEKYSQCKRMVVDNITGIINRQKAEIEYWKEQCFHACMNNGCLNEGVKYEGVKYEAIKEYLANVLEKKDIAGHFAPPHEVVSVSVLEACAKEMMEGKE